METIQLIFKIIFGILFGWFVIYITCFLIVHAILAAWDSYLEKKRNNFINKNKKENG